MTNLVKSPTFKIKSDFVMSDMNDRPHPDPLPQERENGRLVFDDTNTLGCHAILLTKAEQAANTTVTNDFSKDAAPHSLSPGEGESLVALWRCGCVGLSCVFPGKL